MKVQIAAARINKYATSESGVTLEVVEHPTSILLPIEAQIK